MAKAKILTEFIGTFFLVLTIGMVVVGGALPTSVIAIGFALAVLVYMGGHVSGAHYNPAVSLGLFLSGKMSASEFGQYVVAQLLGGFAGAYASYFITGKTFGPAPAQTASIPQALCVEILFTFMLMLVVFNVAVHEKTKGNSFYGLAIGGTIVAAAYAGGPISGGAFNPAVGIGPNLLNMMIAQAPISHIWIYIVGPCIGAVAAGAVYNMQREPEA